MKNLSGCYTRKRALTASTKNKKRDAGLSDCKAKRGIVLCGTAEMEPGRGSEKETTTAAIITGVVSKAKELRLPLFFLFPEIWNESAHTKCGRSLASKMTFLGDWGCASNEQRRPVCSQGHCLLTCEATTIRIQ